MKIISPGSSPFARHGALIDTRGAVLLENVVVAKAEVQLADGRDVYAVELEGRVNRTQVRSDLLYLTDLGGAAHIAAEIAAVFVRQGEPAYTEFMAAFELQLTKATAATAGGDPS